MIVGTCDHTSKLLIMRLAAHRSSTPQLFNQQRFEFDVRLSRSPLLETAGAEHVGMYKKTPASERQYCKKCGGHLMANHPQFGLVDVFATTLPTLKFSPGVHVNYAETVLPIREIAPEVTGHGLPLSKCEAYNRV